MQEKYININSLKISENLAKFVNEELLKDIDISPKKFWLGFEKTVNELEPRNRELINFRELLQKKIDDWHIENKNSEFNLDAYKKFLYETDYLKEEGPDFYIKTNMVINKLGIKKSGYKIITNSGDNGGQEVPHFHIHILGGERLKF